MQALSLETIVKELSADSAAVMVPNVRERHLYCYESFNMPQVWVDIKNSFDEKTYGGNVGVYKTGKTSIVNNLQKMVEGYYIESVMVVPIRREKVTVATLELIHDRDNKIFSEVDLKKAKDFANKINIKIA